MFSLSNTLISLTVLTALSVSTVHANSWAGQGANSWTGHGAGAAGGGFHFGMSGHAAMRGTHRAATSAGAPLTARRVAPASARVPSFDAGAFEVEPLGDRLRVRVPWNVLFDFDRHDLRPGAEPVLRAVTQLVHARRAPSIELHGHTDALGSEAYNLRLSQRRADSVKDWLTNHGGVPSAKIEAVGHGEGRPVAPNTDARGADDPHGRALNRRVEFIL